VDVTGLLSPSERAKVDVLNGIVYDAANDRIYVTGKNWPKLFEIEIVP
jgi:glutamine cyclotransferase